MRRILVTAAIALIITLSCLPVPDLSEQRTALQGKDVDLNDFPARTASAGGSGDDAQAVAFMSRTLEGQVLSVLNSFANTSRHSGIIDLAGYHEPGWTLYRAVMDVDNFTGAPEREVVGANSPTYTYSYAIYEHDDLGPYFYNQLAQGFFNKSHDGLLQNYSILYNTPSYFPALQNYAYFELRSDYENGSTNMIPVLQVPDVGPAPSGVWANITQANLTQPVLLTADSVYYAVINGSLLIKSGIFYPEIFWFYEASDGSFFTSRYNTATTDWTPNLGSREAILNYTYIPWNQTSDSALEFLDPAEIDLKLNGTQASGISWTTSLSDNITSIQLNSNQSAEVHFNLTLWFRQDATSSTLWNAQSSGGLVDWNATMTTLYPVMPGSVTRYLNVSVPLDWTTTGLYNSSNPSTNHTDYMRSGADVICSGIGDETWTLTFEAHNYVTDIRTFDSSDDSELLTKSSVLVDMNINSTVEDQAANGVNTGTTNLTVLHEGTTVYAPSLGGVSGGHSHYLWDIDTASDNGTFLVQVFWSNGTEAGLLTKQMTVFYPTSLTSVTPTSIYANTDSSFTVTVQFDDLFNTAGISSPDAVLTYSYRSIVNDTMNDLGGGTWDVSVGTLNNDSGTDTLTVYAVGPAIENRSLDITVTLTHQTSLQLEWASDTFDWTQYSIFRVNYTHDRDGSRITDADQLDVSVNGVPTFLHGTNGTYWIEFNNTFDLGFHTVFVNISKAGYDPASDGTASFTIEEALTDMSVIWDPTNITIDYNHALNLAVNYTYQGTGGDVPASATVNVTVGGSTYDLSYNGTDWEVSITGWSLGPGLHDANITAWLYGYQAQSSLTLNINVTVSASQLVVDTSWPESTVLYDEIRLLLVNVTYSNGTFTTDATVVATVLSVPYAATNLGNGTYSVPIGPVKSLGTDILVNLTVSRIGFDPGIVPLSLNVTAIPSTVTAVGTFSMYWNHALTLNVTFRDGRNGTAILVDDIVFGWYAGGSSWVQVSPSPITATIHSTDMDIGSYTLNLTIQKAGYQDNFTQWTIQILPVSMSLQFLDVFEEYENETVWISATIQDDFHASAVNWGDVVLHFDGANYTMQYNSTTSAYRVGVWLSSSFPPGDYTFEIMASALNCNSTQKSGNLTILSKVHTVLMLVELDTDIIGNVIPVTVNASRSGLPVPALTITVYARFNISDGTTTLIFESDATDANGIAEVNIDVPASATGAFVWAEYSGSRQEWPASTEVALISVTPQNILGLLFLLIQQPLVLLLLVVVVMVVGTRSLWKGKLQPRRFAAKSALEKQLEAFMELDMVQHFMAVYTDRGTCVFYHPFAQSRIQPDLISGFIAAITSVYGEIKGNGVQGSLEEINYQGLRLNSYSGSYIIGIVIVEGEMSPRLRDRLQFFVEIFEDQYESDLDGWAGLVDCFDPEWVVSNLNTAFNYDWMLPHYVDTKVKLKGAERKIVKLIQNLYGRNEFLIRDILTKVANKLKTTEAEAFDIILRLMDQAAIYPISIHTVLQRQGLGIADEEDVGIYEVKTTPEIDEPEMPDEVEEPEKIEESPPPPEVEEAAEPERVEEAPTEKEEELSEEEKFLKEVEDLMSKEKVDSD
ncbi:MAG: hypothetical protein ACXADO_02475 [Candidatus Thorarchaeota archaeon]|jgi:hypothetical protein